MGAAAAEGRRRPHELTRGRLEGLAGAAHEERDVGALPAPIGVKLVEHQEAEAPRPMDEGPLVLTRQDQLEHHVVREQDVGRVDDDGLLLRLALLAGVAGEPHRWPARRIAEGQELRQLALLAVRESVHRVHDDRLDALAGAAPKHMVDDGDQIDQALPGARSRGQDIRSAGASHADRLVLVAVEPEGPADGIGVSLLNAEDAPTLVVEHVGPDELVDRPARFVCWIELDQRMRPEEPVRQALVNQRADPVVGDVQEGADVVAVLGDKLLAELEDVHGS